MQDKPWTKRGSANPETDTGAGGLKPVTLSVSKIRVLGLGLVCLLFGLACLALMVHGLTGSHHHHAARYAGNGWTETVAGLIGFVFCSGGSCLFVWKKLRAPLLLRLSPAGIAVEGAGFIPWENFDAVGTGRTSAGSHGAKIIGIRVKSQAGLVGTMTPDAIRGVQRVAKAGRFVGGKIPRGIGSRSAQASLAPLRTVPQHDPVAIMQWTRRTSGWDVSWSPLLFNRPSGTVVRIIEDYYQDVLRLRSAR